jgi:type I restriction enzyme, S subunit
MKNGWKTRKLGDLCQTGSGGTPLKSRKEYYEGGTIPWLLSGEVAQGEVREATSFITKQGLANSSAKLFPQDTVLVAMYGATAGQVGILRFEAATNQAICGILPNKHFIPEFLFYFLLSRKDELVAQAAGNAQPNISQIKIRNTDVPIVTLSEQQRIVGILDEAFEGIATAKANAGKNLQNARALFESHLHSILNCRGEGRVRSTIGDQLILQRGFDITKDQQIEGGVPVVSSGGIKSFHNRSMAPAPGVVIGRKGTLGKVFYLENDFWPHDTTLWVKDFKKNNPKFVYYFFTGLDVKRLDSGTANPALNRNQVHPIGISWPPVTEQGAIVAKLDALAAETQHLADLYEQKLAALEALKKSLLHQAFTGQL